jgi:hypothetical protein
MRLRWFLPLVLLAGCPHNKGPNTTGGAGSGSDAPADAAPVAEIEAPAFVPLTGQAFTDPPQCVGFTADGKGAFVLLGYADRSMPHWEISLMPAGEAEDPGDYSASAESDDPAGATKVVQPVVDEINAWADGQHLQGCVKADIPADVTPPEDEVAGPDGVKAIAAFTAPNAGTVVVFAAGGEGGYARQHLVWVPHP